MVLLIDFEISVNVAVVLLGLFALQFLPFFQDFEGLMLFSGVYLLLGIVLLIRRRGDLATVVHLYRSLLFGL